MHYLVYNLRTVHTDLLSPASLDPQEQAAYARRGSRYLLIRTLLKRELARLSGEPAEDIRFTYSESGKPEYAAQPFNLSHSGDLLCLAFHHRPIGVDIERMQPRPRLGSVARRIMSPAGYEDWLTRGSAAEEFYACWCAAEAMAKLCGGSVWQAQQRPFLYRAGHIVPLFEGAPLVELFEPAPGYMGAVATPAEP